MVGPCHNIISLFFSNAKSNQKIMLLLGIIMNNIGILNVYKKNSN